MNTEQKFATFFPHASKGRKLGAIFSWLAAVVLLISLFVPAFKVSYGGVLDAALNVGDSLLGATGTSMESMVKAEVGDLPDKSVESLVGLLCGKNATMAGYLTQQDKGITVLNYLEENYSAEVSEVPGKWVGPVLLAVFVVLVVVSVVTSLFTMSPISLVATLGAVLELLLVYFLRVRGQIEAVFGASIGDSFTLSGINATLGVPLNIIFIAVLVVAVVLQIVGVVLSVVVKDAQVTDDGYWDDLNTGRDDGTGILDNGQVVNTPDAAPAAPAADEVVATIVQMNTGKVFMLKDNTEMVLGKGSQADIIIPNPIISRAHAKITCSRSVCTLQDLGSKNGTFVGDRKLTAGTSAVLKNGDYITLGNEIFEFNK